MTSRLHFLAASLAALCLAACAAAPRAPATSLSEAGVKATGAFSGDVRTVSAQLASVDALDAFSETWERCQNPRLTCAPQVPGDALSQRRVRLAEAVVHRAEALDGLRGAYEALGREAAYDGAGDLGGASERLVAGVNQYTAAVSGIMGNPIPQLVSQPIAGVIRLAAAGIGESRQRRRIIAASRSISAAARALRDGLREEARVFNSLAEYLIQKRTTARLALMRAGLVPRAGVLTPLTQQLGTTLNGNAESLIESSAPLQASVDATVQAMSRAEVLAAQQRYQISIAALDALLAAHERLEAEQPFSLADLLRLVGQLDSAIQQSTPMSAGGEAR